MPRVWPRRFCQAHSPKYGEAGSLMLHVYTCRLGQSGLIGLSRHSEGFRFRVSTGCLHVSHEPAIKRRESRLSDFTPFRLRRVELRSVPELARAQVPGDIPNPVLNVLPA